MSPSMVHDSPDSHNINLLCTAELQLYRRAFFSMGVVLAWDTERVTLTVTTHGHDNSVVHLRDAALGAWLDKALSDVVDLRTLELFGGAK